MRKYAFPLMVSTPIRHFASTAGRGVSHIGDLTAANADQHAVDSTLGTFTSGSRCSSAGSGEDRRVEDQHAGGALVAGCVHDLIHR
jgi:hypothetical protein